MNVDDRFKGWFKNQSDLEKIDIIKKYSSRLLALKKQLDKATKAELDYGFNRIGVRGGKFTTLNAKSDNCARMYVDCLEELKYMIKNI